MEIEKKTNEIEKKANEIDLEIGKKIKVQREQNLCDQLKNLKEAQMVCYEIMNKNIFEMAQKLLKDENSMIITKAKCDLIHQSSTIQKQFVHEESLSGWGILGFLSFGESKSTNDFFLMEIDTNPEHICIKINNVIISTPITNNILKTNTSWELIDERNLKIESFLDFEANQFGYGRSEFIVTVNYE